MCASRTPPPPAIARKPKHRSHSVHVSSSTVDDHSSKFQHTPHNSASNRNSTFSNGLYHTPFPPPLPERPSTRESVTSVKSSGPASPDAVTLDEFIMKNSRKFPASIVIETGVYGNASFSSLYEEKMALHFEMRMKVVRATFEKGGTYHIPLCSAEELSLLHNPNDNLQQALLGHYYETVGHILTQQIRPLVVCVTSSYSSADVSISDGEILMVSPKVHTKTFKGGKFIKCISVQTGEQKLLHESVKGGFTTHPEKTKMLLSQIWNNKYFQPPLKAIMHHKLPQLVLQKNAPVTLLSELWEDAVIATKDVSQSDKNCDAANRSFLRIRKDTGISVIPSDLEAADGTMKLQDEASVKKIVDYKFLCEKTRDMFQNFNLLDISQHIFLEDPVWPSFEEVQSYLYKHILHDYDVWKDSVQLKRPEHAFKGQTSKKSKSKDSGSYENVQASKKRDDYSQLEPVDLKTIDKPEEVELYAPVQGGKFEAAAAAETVQEIPNIAHLLHEVNTANRQIMIEVDKLKAEMEGLKMELRQTKQIMGYTKRDLSETMKRLETDVIALKDDYIEMEKSPSVSIEVENQQILRKLTPMQVIEALQILNLSRYVPEFQRRNLTGYELTQCDEQILSSELNVRSRLDLIRMMMFIQGRESVWKVLEDSHNSSVPNNAEPRTKIAEQQ